MNIITVKQALYVFLLISGGYNCTQSGSTIESDDLIDSRFRSIPQGSQTTVYTVERVQSVQYENENDEYIADVIANFTSRSVTFIKHSTYDSDSVNDASRSTVGALDQRTKKTGNCCIIL
eukprot:95571_1